MVVFQSTLPRGSDLAALWAEQAINGFQSTLPRGSDYSAPFAGYSIADFNPRSLAGATELKRLQKLKQQFQSTLPRGSDQSNQ